MLLFGRMAEEGYIGDHESGTCVRACGLSKLGFWSGFVGFGFVLYVLQGFLVNHQTNKNKIIFMSVLSCLKHQKLLTISL